MQNKDGQKKHIRMRLVFETIGLVFACAFLGVIHNYVVGDKLPLLGNELSSRYGIKEIGVEELDKKLVHSVQKSREFVLVDLRSRQDYKLGHIPSAVNLPSTDVGRFLRRMMGRFERKEIILYGKDDRAISSLVRKIHELSFHNIYVLNGGYSAWFEFEKSKRKTQ